MIYSNDGPVQRFRDLKSLDEDHDGEGAAAPDHDAIDTAIEFVRFLPAISPSPVVGIDQDGNAVVEFRDGPEFGQVIFSPGRFVEVFFQEEGQDPVHFEGSIDDPRVARRFLETFGFNVSSATCAACSARNHHLKVKDHSHG